MVVKTTPPPAAPALLAQWVRSRLGGAGTLSLVSPTQLQSRLRKTTTFPPPVSIYFSIDSLLQIPYRIIPFLLPALSDSALPSLPLLQRSSKVSLPCPYRHLPLPASRFPLPNALQTALHFDRFSVASKHPLSANSAMYHLAILATGYFSGDCRLNVSGDSLQLHPFLRHQPLYQTRKLRILIPNGHLLLVETVSFIAL